MTSPAGPRIYGTQYLEDDGRLVAIVDRHGLTHARLSWQRGIASRVDQRAKASASIAGEPHEGGWKLVELWVPGAIVRGAIVDDPLLGSAHEIVVGPRSMSASSNALDATSMSANSNALDATSMSANSNALDATSMSANSNGRDATRVLTTVSAIDWSRPTEIPAIAAPGKLPFGVGGSIMNVLAVLAQRAGVHALHYAGPYPTNALWSTLVRSFQTADSEDDFVGAFAERAGRVARDRMPAVFVPAPHERVTILSNGESRGIAELRHGIERATIDGIVFTRETGVALLLDDDERDDDARTDDARANDARADDARANDARANDARDHEARDHEARDHEARDHEARDHEARDHKARPTNVRAELWFTDERYAHIATLSSGGELLDGPHPVPACESDVVGKGFPPEMVAALAELIAELVPPPLAKAATHVVAGRALRWADLGARAAACVGEELHLHAALWQLRRHGMSRLAMALVDALVPVVTPLAAASMAETR